jgi:periplasmic protein TonB
MEEHLSWRHALALFVTLTSAWLIWHGTRLILTEPSRARHLPLMHVSLASPPAPPAPVLPKVVPKPPKPVVPKQVATRTPIQTSPHAIGPPVVNAPVTSQNVAPSPPSPPAPAAPAENLSLESTYLASARAAIEQEKRYPMSKDARLQQPSGTVTVWFVLNRAGELQDIGIAGSAGSILDRAAIESVRRTTFAPFPTELWPRDSQHRFIVYLRFVPS